MLPLTKTVWTASTAHTVGASPRKTRAQKVFIARRSSRFHEAASSVQHFNANHVKRKFFSFASWNLFRMEDCFPRCHHEWKNNFLLPSRSRFIELPLLAGSLP